MSRTQLQLNLATAYKSFCQKKISLEEAVRIALEQNTDVQQAILSESGYKEDLKQAHAEFYPSLSAGNVSSFNFARTTNPATNLIS